LADFADFAAPESVGRDVHDAHPRRAHDAHPYLRERACVQALFPETAKSAKSALSAQIVWQGVQAKWRDEWISQLTQTVREDVLGNNRYSCYTRNSLPANWGL
jgi:hypothetical protein